MGMGISRRRMVSGSLAAGAGMALCRLPLQSGSAQTPESDAAASPVASGWSFTDDRGITVTLPEMPTRVIAQTSSAASLWDFGFEVVGFFGPVDPDNAAGFPQVGDIDVDRIPNLGDFGALDLEKVVELQAQLYVDLDRGGGSLWYLDPDSQAALEKICPTIGLNAVAVTVIDIVKRYEDLAVALGVDPQSEQIAAAKEAHATAEAAFAETVGATPGLKVLTISAGTDGNVYIWNPNWLPDLIYFESLGMTAVDPGVAADIPNAVVSFEELGNYPADVILVDVRGDLADLEGNALWEGLPAVQAGQVGYWYAAFAYSYQRLAEVLDLTGETLSGASVVV